MLSKFMEILVSQGASQGGSSSARSFDLARHGVAPPMVRNSK